MRNSSLLLVISILLILILCACPRQTNRAETPPQPGSQDSGNPDQAEPPEDPGELPPDLTGKLVMEIDSYSDDYSWTVDLSNGVRSVLEPTGATLEVIRLDAKNNPQPEYIARVCREAFDRIQEMKPDLIIVSDDIAVRDLVVPYLMDRDTPVVFCGVNWDASVYGLPTEHITGQIEVALIDKMVVLLKRWAGGERIGLLSTDTLTAQKNIKYIKDYFEIEFTGEYIADNFEDWKQGFLSVQEEADMVIIASTLGLGDATEEEMQAFAVENYKIPSATWNETFLKCAMLGVLKDPEEVGTWTGTTAVKILTGTQPSQIEVAQNNHALISINMTIADKLGLVIDSDILRNASVFRLDGLDPPGDASDTEK